MAAEEMTPFSGSDGGASYGVIIAADTSGAPSGRGDNSTCDRRRAASSSLLPVETGGGASNAGSGSSNRTGCGAWEWSGNSWIVVPAGSPASFSRKSICCRMPAMRFSLTSSTTNRLSVPTGVASGRLSSTCSQGMGGGTVAIDRSDSESSERAGISIEGDSSVAVNPPPVGAESGLLAGKGSSLSSPSPDPISAKARDSSLIPAGAERLSSCTTDCSNATFDWSRKLPAASLSPAGGTSSWTTVVTL